MSPEERLWQTLVDEVGEDMIEEAASVSVAEAEAYLTAAGFDVAAERARAESFLVSLEAGAAAEEPVQAVAQAAPAAPTKEREPKKGRPVGLWIAAAAAVAAGAAAVVYATKHPQEQATPEPPVPPSTAAPVHPAPDELAAAADLRHRAAAACDQGRADDCLAMLDEARAKDPAGDSAPEVLRLREKAASGLKPKPPHPK
ncbi:MAG TPA: hypothetical protein VGL81_18280 [Polyangiaceae bacterium]